MRAKWHLLSPAWNFIFLDQIHTFIWSAKKMTFREFIQNMSKTLSKCLSKWIKVDKWDYLKNPSQELKSSFCLGFLWIPKKTGRQNWRGPIFLRFNLVKLQCEQWAAEVGATKPKTLKSCIKCKKKSNLTRLGFYVVWENVLNTPKLSIFACPDWIELDALRPLGKLSESRIYRNWAEILDYLLFSIVYILIFG